MTSTDFAIRAKNISKRYTIYDHPSDRLKQMLMRGKRQYFREFWALRETNFEIAKGKVMGLVGRNGAGKSTLLQLICGTLAPTGGSLEVRGRVAALLELGSGFNMEFSGRENVYVYASIMGLSKTEIDKLFDGIVNFSGIGDFIDQPVKTYSSGMFVRLAFSVATSVDPDILIIDEALSVGDGEFARKSFDRIRSMKDAGKTILFCSHSLYQVEVFCDQVLWLDEGRSMILGEPAEVIKRYEHFLLGEGNSIETEKTSISVEPVTAAQGYARFVRVEVRLDDQIGRAFKGQVGENDLSIKMQFESDPQLPAPTVGVSINQGLRIDVTCAVSLTDMVSIERDAQGRAEVQIEFTRMPLRKGEYWIYVHLGCENALYIYESVHVATITINDPLPEPGIVNLVHFWKTQAGHSDSPLL